MILAGFRMGTIVVSCQEEGVWPVCQILLKARRRTLVIIQTGGLKIGNVFCQVQLQCREIY